MGRKYRGRITPKDIPTLMMGFKIIFLFIAAVFVLIYLALVMVK